MSSNNDILKMPSLKIIAVSVKSIMSDLYAGNKNKYTCGLFHIGKNDGNHDLIKTLSYKC